MWDRLEASAVELEALGREWIARSQISRPGELSLRIAEAIVDSMGQIINSSDPLPSSELLRKLQRRVHPLPLPALPPSCPSLSPPAPRRSLAPVRRTLTLLSNTMDTETDPLFDRIETIAIAYAAATAALQPVYLALQSRDETFSQVPFWILQSLIDTVAFLNPLTAFFSATPLEIFPQPPTENGMPCFFEGMLEMVHQSVKTQHIILNNHPNGRLIENDGDFRMRETAAVLWRLTPDPLRYLRQALELDPPASRALYFKWIDVYAAFHGLSARFSTLIPQNLSAAIPVLSRTIDAVAQALTTGDALERQRVHSIVRDDAVSVVLAVFGWATAAAHPRRDVHLSAIETAANPANGQLLARSLMRLFDATDASSTPKDLALAADLLGAAAGSLCVLCAYNASEVPGDNVKAMLGISCVNLIQITGDCWIGVVRRCQGATELNLWAHLIKLSGEVVEMFLRVLKATIVVGEGVMDMLYRSRSGENDPLFVVPQRASAVPLVGVVRSLAKVAASIPAALALADRDAASEGTQRYEVFSAQLHEILAKMHVAAAGYAHIALSCRERDIADLSDAAMDKNLAIVAEASHACLHTALALQASGCLSQETDVGEADAEVAVVEWHQLATLVAGALDFLEKGGPAVAAVALHSIVALGPMPHYLLEDAVGVSGSPLNAAKMVAAAATALRPTLLPSDALGLEKLLQHGQPTPETVQVLEQLIEAARSTENVEQRHRARFGLLERLPRRICANLRCKRAFGACGDLRVCSGCKSVRYCTEKCAKVGWREGHQTACQAVQQERRAAAAGVGDEGGGGAAGAEGRSEAAAVAGAPDEGLGGGAVVGSGGAGELAVAGEGAAEAMEAAE